MNDESLEIALNGKHYMISLKPLHSALKNELRSVFANEVEPLQLLKLYITKAQEYALICESLENLYSAIEGVDSSIMQGDVQIQPL